MHWDLYVKSTVIEFSEKFREINSIFSVMAKIHKDSTKKEPDQPNAIITEVEDEDDEIEEFVPMTRCQIKTVQIILIFHIVEFSWFFTVWKFHSSFLWTQFFNIEGTV